MADRLTGLIAAPHSPFAEGGGLNLDVVEAQADWLIGQRVSGAFVCGTTGEGTSLTFDERMRLAERWVSATRGRLKVIVHVGHNSIGEAIELAKHARGLKPFAVSAMPPTFFKPGTIDALVATCSEIASAAGSVPFYYYHIPSMSGVDLSMVKFLEAASPVIPTLRGIKYTHNDLLEYRQCLMLHRGRFDVPFGRDEMLLAALAYGAKGAVGSTYNYAAPAYLKMMRAFAEGDMGTCREVADGVIRLVGVLRSLGEIATGKAIMTWLGVELGPPRLPLKPLTVAQQAALEEFLAETDLLTRGGSQCNENGKATESSGSVPAPVSRS